MKKTRPDGFTLVECLWALAVVAVLVGIALPAYSRAQARTRVALLQSELVEAMLHATRVSIASGSNVVICVGETSCLPTPDWSKGWLAFIDADGDRALGATESTLLQHPTVSRGYRVTSSAGRTFLVFNTKGATPGSNTTFTICDIAGRTQAQSLVIANSGRMRRQPATAGAAEACRNAVPAS